MTAVPTPFPADAAPFPAAPSPPDGPPTVRLYAPPGGSAAPAAPQPAFGAPPPAAAAPAPDPTAAAVPPAADGPTLAAVYRDYVLPDLTARGRSPATLSDQRSHLRRWSAAWAELGEPEPSVAAVRLADLQRFRAHLLGTLRGSGGGPAGPRTVNKYLGTVQQIGRAAVRHELTRGFPVLDQLPAAPPAKRYLSVEEVGRLYAAAGAATWPASSPAARPRRPDPAAEWRLLLVLAWNYGFRTSEVWRCGSHARPLTWAQICWGTETPDAEGQATCPWGWLWYTPEKQKRFKPKPLVLPMNHAVRSHLAARWAATRPPADAPVVDWPASPKSFARQLAALCDAAGVRPRRVAGDLTDPPPYTFKNLRKTCATYHNLHRKGAGKLVLGHAARGVHEVHYDSPEWWLVEALTTFPQPAEFTAAGSPAAIAPAAA